ncbi:unnamed protein product [Parajaminaea phylloscopi]
MVEERFTAKEDVSAKADRPEAAASEQDSDCDSTAQQPEVKKKKKSKKSKKKKPAASHPTSKVDDGLAIPDGVAQHYFDAVKGKGFVATRDFAKDELIFTDEAFVAAPPMSHAKKVEQGSLCDVCFQPVQGPGMGLNVGCKGKDCSSVWCNRDCEAKARSKHHNLLCRGNNPSVAPFLDFLSAHPYLSLHSTARLYALILLSHSPSPSRSLSHAGGTTTLEETLSHVDAFATISELVRRKRNPGWDMEKSAFEATFRQALALLKKGLDPWDEERVARGEQGGIRGKGKWIVNPDFSKKVAQDLFSWEGFMRALGRANLNLEAQGGLYCIHSHLNHSCDPNTEVHHPPNRRGIRQATRVSLHARRDIAKGEELVITYQDPSVGVRRRNLLLWREHIFGPCQCTRCLREQAELDEEDRQGLFSFLPTKEDKEEVELRRKQADVLNRQQEARQGGEEKKDLSGLEDELRQTLGF